MSLDKNNPSLIHPIEDSTPTHVPIPRRYSGASQILWLVFTSLSVILFIIGLPDRYAELLNAQPEVQRAIDQAGITNLTWTIGMLVPEIFLMLVFTTIGISLFMQKSRDLTILLVSLLLVSWGTTIMNVIEALISAHPNIEIWVTFSRAVAWSLVMTILLIFPNGRLYPKWSKWLLAFWYVWIWSWFFFPSLPHNISIHGGFAHPVRFILYFFLLALGIFAQIRRFTKISSATERQRAKWAFLGIGLMFVITFLEEAPSALDPLLVGQTSPDSIWYSLISTVIFVLGSIAFPLGIVASIQQKRLWKIDYVINRSLLYTLITGFLVLSFFIFFQVLQILFSALSNNQQPTTVGIISALIAVSLFSPARTTLQRFIDRRIFNIQINYQRPPSPKKTFSFHLLEEQQLIGDYEIVEMIARGGMSEIFKGRHVASGEEAAIKILLEPLAGRMEFRKRFAHEAKIISQMDHPNIVKLYDFGESGEIYYIIMEFVSYHTLDTNIKTNAPLSLEYTHHIIHHTAQALDYAHQQGIIHRDVKPSNLLLRNPDDPSDLPQPVLTDFGIAKVTYSNKRRISKGFVGSFDYISPEQIQASDTVDHRTDIYSLGVLAFQMLTGKLPFEAATNAETLIAHIQQPPPNILAFNPGLPDQAAFAILKAMSKDPGDRFNQAGLFAQALQP